MRAAVVFLIFLFALSSCLEFPTEEVGYVPLVLKSASGFSSETGEIYVQRSISVGLEVTTSSTNTDVRVVSATWKIDESTYSGTQIFHKFNSSGKVTLSVEALLSSGVTVKKDFIVNVVEDLSSFDPVIIKSLSQSGGKTEMLILISRERLRYATDTAFYYIGNMTDWKNIRVYPKSYIVNDKGEAVLVSDVGKYLGFKLILADGDYEMAFVHSNNIWADLSGSVYIKKDNPGKLKFAVKGRDIIAMGDNGLSYLPGTVGDSYFRFTQNTAKVDLYFKLDANCNANAFYTYQLANGQFSQTIFSSFSGGIEIQFKKIKRLML